MPLARASALMLSPRSSRRNRNLLPTSTDIAFALE
jgi:hypothetical protein